MVRSVLQLLSVSSCCTVVGSIGTVCMIYFIHTIPWFPLHTHFPWLLKMVCFIGLRFREVVVVGGKDVLVVELFVCRWLRVICVCEVVGLWFLL